MRTILILCLALLAGPVRAETLASSLGPLQLDRMAGGLEEPWGLAFLPDGGFLVTERDGRLMLFPASGGDGRPVDGVPQVYARGQGGLLDVMVPRDFPDSREVWLSYAATEGRGAGTALGVGRLAEDGTRLEAFRAVFAAPGTPGGRHFGSRIVEGADGLIYLTIGDRGTGHEGLEAQDPARAEGKIMAFRRDGSPAVARDGWLPGVFSLGHRNPQGMALDGQGRLWAVEHGAQGGDELNLIREGANYGWPVISYGEDYGGGRIGVGTAQPGLEQPAHYWDPSIAPSGMMIHSGRMFPEWQGDIFIGSLKFDHIARLDPDAGFAEERLETPQAGRVRDVREGPDGAIWFLSVYEGAVFRLSR